MLQEYVPVHQETTDDGATSDEPPEADIKLASSGSATPLKLSVLFSRTKPLIPHAWSQSTDFKAFSTRQDEVGKSPAMSQNARILRVLAFLVLEALWLGFGLIVNSNVIETPSGGEPFTIAGVPTSRDALFKSGLSAVANLWQLIVLLFVGDIVKETFSGEWAHMFSHANSRLAHDTDRVSTLISGYIDQTVHATDRRSSSRYRFAFATALLALVLQTIAPGAVSVGLDTVSTPTTLTIGGLRPNSTYPTVPPMFLGSTGDTIGDHDEKTVLARKLPLKATRFVYSAMAEHSRLDFQVNSNNTLFGMPPRSMLSQHLKYSSDAVFYNFDCRWVAPTFLGDDTSVLDSNWTLGGDVVGTPDYNAQPDLSAPEPQWLFGLWPLLLQSGPGALNGSFAWLVFGSNATYQVDLSSIPESGKTFNDSGWYDLVLNIKASGSGHAEDYGIYTTWASVLFCDPQMELGTVDVEVENQVLSPTKVGDGKMRDTIGTVGNIDPVEAGLMLGRSLNGMTWDAIRSGLEPPFDADSDISRLAFEFSLLQSANPNNSAVFPQSLSNISASLGLYMMVAGSSAYLDGTVGTKDVPAQSLRDIQRLVCSWPQWGASVGIAILVVLLLSMMIVLERTGTEPVIPLTLATVADALRREHIRRNTEEGKVYDQEAFSAETLYDMYSKSRNDE